MTSKEEYLKRYLSSDQKSVKKKKKPKTAEGAKKATSNRFQILDADADVPVFANKKTEEDEEEKDEPVVALVDVRADELKLLGKFKTDSWQTLKDRNARRHDTSDEEDQPRSSTNDHSPPRRQRHDSDHSDQSPPRRRVDQSDRRRHDSDQSDQSPPRRRDRDDDLSPPRHSRQERDLSPPRRRNASEEVSRKSIKREPQSDEEKEKDQSPKRRRRDSGDSDISVERKNGGRGRGSPDRDKTPKILSDKKMTKTLSGASAGLQNAKELRKEAEMLRKRTDDMFSKIDDTVSGKYAETVLREKGTGKRRDLKQEKKLSEEEQKKRAELEAKYKLWNKGVKQVADRESRLEELAKEATKPLARYEGDEDLETHLKEQELKEDPMLEYMRKKKVKVAEKQGKKMYPKYNGPAIYPNRFGILPGYRWDGVDRSNGFETKLVSTKNLRKADEEEAYKWSMGTYE